MARQGIGTGSSPNDGTGDNLRAAGGKINDNFSELYEYFGDGTTLSQGTWDIVSSGINTLSSVGIGTTNPRFTLEVGAVGASGTSLYVNGDARVTGILTVGSSSVTLNGSTNEITVGTGITISGNTGIISATQVTIAGETLTGAGVTSLVAGSNITLSGSTGQVTISSSGGGSAGAGGTWSNYDSNAGVSTTKKVKIQNNLEVTGVTTSTGGFVGALTGNATGLTGTPDINVRNIVGVAATFTGVLTYEDVTNIDSVGLVTARSGVRIVGGGLTVTGVSTFHSNVELPDGQHLILGDGLDDSGNFKLYNGANEPFEIFGSAKEVYIRNTGSNANGININANASVTLGGGGSGGFSVQAETDGTAKLYGPGPLLKLQTTTGGISITGTSTCTGGVQIGAGQSFGANGPTAVYYGDGSNLTGLSGGGSMNNVVDDTTPQLGGNLDVNSKDIVSTSNGDIDLDPNGSGVVVFKGNSTKGSGQLKLNCEQNSHGIIIKGPPHSAGANYTLTLPDDDGSSSQVLSTNGSGVLSWANQPDISGKANLASPTFTGTPGAPTAGSGTNTTQLATTAFVTAAVAAGGGGGGGGGAMEYISTQTVSSATASVGFDLSSTDYDFFIVKAYGCKFTAAPGNGYCVYFNFYDGAYNPSSVGTNRMNLKYQRSQLDGGSVTTSSAYSYSVTLYLGWTPTTSANFGFNAEVGGKTNSPITITSNFLEGTTTSSGSPSATGVAPNSSNNMTYMTVMPSTTTFAAGTFLLYGVKNS